MPYIIILFLYNIMYICTLYWTKYFQTQNIKLYHYQQTFTMLRWSKHWTVFFRQFKPVIPKYVVHKNNVRLSCGLHSINTHLNFEDNILCSLVIIKTLSWTCRVILIIFSTHNDPGKVITGKVICYLSVILVHNSWSSHKWQLA